MRQAIMSMSVVHKAYLITWNELVNYLKDPYHKFIKDNRDNPKLILEEYQKKVVDIYRPILFAFAGYIKSNEIGLGRSIIHINSFNSNQRIRIPFIGSLPNRDLNWDHWLIEQVAWSEKVINENNDSKQLMFIQPDKPSHLLTELMWRFQPWDKWGEGFTVGIFKEEDVLYGLLNSIGSKTYTINDKSWNIVKSELVGILNTWRHGVEQISLMRDYTGDDIEIFMKRPYQIIKGELDIFRDTAPSNIIYLPDIVETQYLGGIDFEIYIKDPKKFSNSTMNCIEFLKTIQWFMSKYIIELISTAERNYASAGELYKEVYFKSDNIEYECINNLSNILNLSNPIYTGKNFRLSNTVKEVYKKIENHFSLSNSTHGLYWRGYRRHVFEVACVVAGLIDILFLDENFDLEGILRSCGPRLEKLNFLIERREKEITDETGAEFKLPYLFKQLLSGLIAEEKLFLIPLYREHFIHSFYCFTFGLIFMGLGPDKLIPKNLSLTFRKSEFGWKQQLRTWFIIAMWHDIAYVLQKGHEILESYLKRFIKEDEIPRFRNILPWLPSLGHLMQIDGLVEKMRNVAKDSLWRSKKCSTDKIPEGDLVIATAFDKIDHGIWSAMILKHGMDRWLKRIFPLVKKTKKLNKILRAILVHHLSSWNIDKLLEDYHCFDKDKFVEKEFDASNIVRINTQKNEFGYLLAICDLICQAGREAPEIAGKHPSKIGIRIKNIIYHTSGLAENSLQIDLDYSKKEIPLETLIEDHYEKPATYLGIITDNSEKRNVLLLRISIDGSGPKELWLAKKGR